MIQTLTPISPIPRARPNQPAIRVGISTSVIQRGRSGVAQYVLGLTRAWVAHAPQLEFVLFVLEEDLPLFDFAKEAMKLVPVNEQFRPPVQNIVWHQVCLPSLVREHQLDVLHIPSYRRLLWRRPCAMVGTIHDLAPFHLEAKYDWKRMLYGRIVAGRLAHRQDRIIAVSEHTAGDLTRFFGIPRSRITLVYNGIDHERFYPGSRERAKAAASERYGLNHPFFLYVSRLEHPAKNHVRLIAAFEMFKAATQSRWQLVFGGSDWHGAPVIHEAIKRSPCSADIRILGFVPDSSLPDLYCAAEVLVYPSLHEGFGLPPVEAMACGCPVICSQRGALGEVVGEAAAIIEPEDIHSLARELYILGTSESARNRWRAAGLARARKFDWNQSAVETLQVYKQVQRLAQSHKQDMV